MLVIWRQFAEIYLTILGFSINVFPDVEIMTSDYGRQFMSQFC